MIFIIQGCRDVGEDLFRSGRDAAIGRSIKDWLRAYPHEKGILEDGKIEYQFAEKNGCKWAFITDTDDIAVSWRYISDPKLCKERFSLGPF